MVPPTRRAVLRSAGGLAGLTAASSLSGCLGLFGNSGSSVIDENSPATDIPQRAGALLHVDFEAILDADGILSSTNAALNASSSRVIDPPGSVIDATDRLEGTYGLDPREMNRATAFVGEDIATTPTAADTTTPYWGVLGESDWGDDAMRESFRNAAPSRVTESTYKGQTIQEIGAETLSVIGDGTVVLGSKTAVQDTLDVANGEGNGVSGELRRIFDSADGEYAQFGINLDMGALASATLGSRAVDAIPFTSMQHIYGSLFDDGDEQGLRVVTKMGSATKAEQLAAQVDSFVGIARAQGIEGPLLGHYESTIREIETESDGKTMTTTYRAPQSGFDRLAGKLLADLLVGIRPR